MSNVRRFSLIAALALLVAAVAAPGSQAAWSPAPWTLPTTQSQFLESSCSSSTFCIFAGNQTTGATRGLLYRLNGTTYSATTPSTTTAEYAGVSCTATFCMAVGRDFVTGNPGRADKYNGTTWDTTAFATPAGATTTEPRGVSCAGTTSCAVVGRYQTAAFNTGLVETWNGTSWTHTLLTRPSGTTALELNDVSCPTTTTCTAVGWYESAQPRTPIAYRFNGSTWTTQLVALPAGGITQSELTGVSCPTTTTCQAVGYYQDLVPSSTSLGETWNGTTWSTRTVPTATTGQDSVLNDISCYAFNGCIGVGYYLQSDNGNIEKNVTLWNGSTWAQQTDSRQMSVSDAQLNGVSCPSATTCRAVGVSSYDGTTIGLGNWASIDVGT